MAAPRLLSLSRLLTTTTTTRTSSTFLSRSFSTTTLPTPTRFSLLTRARAICSVHVSPPAKTMSLSSIRTFASRHSQAYMNDNNRPPKETILLDGCDFEHYLVVVDKPPEEWTRDDIIDHYVKTLAKIVGSEEEARMKIYSVSTRHYYAFGALVNEELSYKLKELEGVRWVLPDSYLDVKNKDYGGEPFINGQAVPYDPKYHEEWVRNNQKAQERNRRSDRPRNSDRSRNFDRRQRPQGFQNNPNPMGPGGNMGGGMPNQPGGPPNNAGYGPNQPPSNAGFGQNAPPSNVGYGQNMPPGNAGYGQNMPPNNVGYGQNMPPVNAGYQQNAPQRNPGYGQEMPPNNNPGFAHNRPPSNMGSAPPNYGGQGNPGFPNNGMPNYQAGGGMPHQNSQPNYPPQNNVGGQPGGAYQSQNVPGRDMPPY